MARIAQLKFLDDLDGSPATETVRFSVDREDYEIDLNSDHASALREVIASYRAAARPLSRRPQNRVTGNSSSGSASRAYNRAVRAWARAHGHAVPDRGRIPARLAAAFRSGDPGSLPGLEDARAEHPLTKTSVGRTDNEAAARLPEAEDAADAGTGRRVLTKVERETIRSWAQEQGIEVKPRGQLKQDLISNYRAWAERVGRRN